MENLNQIEKFDDYAVMTILSEAHGEFKVKIDLEDVEKVQLLKWVINTGNRKMHYAYNNKGLLLHRYVMDAPKGKDVDHIFGDTMDNRKSQLRICSRSENMSNSKHYANNTSGHRGVTWYKKNSKWMAYIMINYKHKNLGYYDEIEDAVAARKRAEEEHLHYKLSLQDK